MILVESFVNILMYFQTIDKALNNVYAHLCNNLLSTARSVSNVKSLARQRQAERLEASKRRF
jgi:hypothetical protein